MSDFTAETQADSQAATEAIIERCAAAVEKADPNFPAEEIAANPVFRLIVIRSRRWAVSPYEALEHEAKLEESVLREGLTGRAITPLRLVRGLGGANRIPFRTWRQCRLPTDLRRRPPGEARTRRCLGRFADVLFLAAMMYVFVYQAPAGTWTGARELISAPAIASYFGMAGMLIGGILGYRRRQRLGRRYDNITAEATSVPIGIVAIYAPLLSTKTVAKLNWRLSTINVSLSGFLTAGAAVLAPIVLGILLWFWSEPLHMVWRFGVLAAVGGAGGYLLFRTDFVPVEKRISIGERQRQLAELVKEIDAMRVPIDS